jgi:hypothetical protein
MTRNRDFKDGFLAMIHRYLNHNYLTSIVSTETAV